MPRSGRPEDRAASFRPCRSSRGTRALPSRSRRRHRHHRRRPEWQIKWQIRRPRARLSSERARKGPFLLAFPCRHDWVRTSDPYRLCTGGLRKGLLGFFSLITTSSEVGGCRLGLVIADLSFSAPLSAGGVGWRGARTQVASRRATARLTLRVHRPAGGIQGPRRRWGFETRSETQFCQRGVLDGSRWSRRELQR
jgi:hypothetical protein